jgi:hypothetical protein
MAKLQIPTYVATIYCWRKKRTSVKSPKTTQFRDESKKFTSLKGRDILAQGNALGNRKLASLSPSLQFLKVVGAGGGAGFYPLDIAVVA